MAELITPADVVAEMLRISGLLDQAHDELVAASKRWSEAEDRYRLSKADSFLSTTGTVDARKAQVDKVTSAERRAAHEAEGLKVAALERVRSYRAQLSALQSVNTSVRSELELAGRYEP